MYSQVRKSFIDFFEKNDHLPIPSSSLVPAGDDSLMFTNSGMVQFKDNFLGLSEPKSKRVVTVQKALRAGGKHNDLDNVGYTTRHHTFFEMLGNFSFGDYFKEKAILYAWEYLTKIVALNPNKLIITVYHEDTEAKEIWKKITGFGDDQILKISTNDNFWSMGDTGPCGPCSEIYYDYGDHIAGGLPGTPTSDDGERYVEIWNLVFMQYNQINPDKRLSLGKPSIDTGMGLERLVSVLEGKRDNYETSLFKVLIQHSREALLDNSPKNNTAYRVIADHIRAIAFMIADDIVPSNVGRGYVLRRIMRRAMRYAYQVNKEKCDISLIVPNLVDLMSDAYPELRENNNRIIQAIQDEQEVFLRTLGVGIEILDKEIEFTLNSSPLRWRDDRDTLKVEEVVRFFPAQTAFKLYDTYGFPIDLTQDILRQHNISINMKEYEKIAQEHKEISKGNETIGASDKQAMLSEMLQGILPTEFVGYDVMQIEARILKTFSIGDMNYLVTDKTCFYPTGGGEVGDIGLIINGNKEYRILDTKKYGDIILHIISSDVLKVGDVIFIKWENRPQKSIHHTSTHLLNAALKKVLHSNINQKGSYCDWNGARFDFNFPRGLTTKEIQEIESIINQWIRDNLDVKRSLMKKEDLTKNKNIVALFDEKYGDEVKVISVGNNDIVSAELCGGTHVSNTSQIQDFMILSESSIASGVRRIEILAGDAVKKYKENQLIDAKNEIISLKTELERTKKELAVVKVDVIKNDILSSEILDYKDQIKLCYYELENFDKNLINTLCDKLRSARNDLLFIIIVKPTAIVVTSSINDISCLEILKQITVGGGNRSFAQGKYDGIDIKYKLGINSK